MPRTLKTGFAVSLALHAVVALNWKCFWHAPSLPSGANRQPMSITLVAGEEVEAVTTSSPPTAMATAQVEPPQPMPAPEPTPASVASVQEITPQEVKPVPKPPEPSPAPNPPLPAPVTEGKAATPQPTTQAAPSSPSAPLLEAITGPRATNSVNIASARNVAVSSTVTTGAAPGLRATPTYRVNPEPPYPATARRRRQEGLVLLAVRVTSQGRASRIELKQSSGFPALDEAAWQAVRGWEFEPARLGALAVESEIEVPVRFKLTN